VEFAPFDELQPCYFHVSACPATRLTLADEVKAIDDGTIEDTGILDGSLILSAAEHPDLYARALAMQRADPHACGGRIQPGSVKQVTTPPRPTTGHPTRIPVRGHVRQQTAATDG